MSYSKTTTISKFGEQLDPIKNFYKTKCVNWRGNTSDTHERYTEVISAELLKSLDSFDDIDQITRESTYCRPNHNRIEIDLENSNREEENFAKRINRLEFNHLGKILDFQVPLKNKKGDKGVGKIDLLSFNEAENTLYLVEFKHGNNQETLLRALLEGYTYSKIVDSAKLSQDFGLGENPPIVKPAVLVTPWCRALSELLEMESGSRPNLKALAKALSISFFMLEFQERMIAY